MASKVFSIDGQLLGKYYHENRTPVTAPELSPHIIKALLAAEDIRFYKHSGIDLKALTSIPYYVLTGSNRGGSTLTQQVAKNLFKTRSKESGWLGSLPLLRPVIIKMKEWLVAFRLEQAYTKEEILLLYLNTVDFGSNSFGIHTAAKSYFSVTPKQLTVPQAAMLAGLLKATTSYNPILNYDRSLTRRNLVMSQMVKYGFLSSEACQKFKKEPITLNRTPQLDANGPRNYYTVYLTKKLEEWCAAHNKDLYSDGLEIYLTIDSRMQKLAEKAVEEKMTALQKIFYEHWGEDAPWIDRRRQEIPNYIEEHIARTALFKSKKKQTGSAEAAYKALEKPVKRQIYTIAGWKDTLISPMDSVRHYQKFLHTGLLSINPRTAHIKAWVGGINYGAFQLDHITQSRRQPGSTFKPFVYAAALSKGYSPCYKIKDTLSTFSYLEATSDGLKRKYWTPRNADAIYTGMMMSLRHAMGRSVNTVTSKLSQEIGSWRTVNDFARRFGITSPLDTFPSIALGSSEITMLEMVPAYCTFFNQGTWQSPLLIARIEDRNGEVLEVLEPQQREVISKETAWLMTYMLRGTIEEPKGTAQGLYRYDVFRGNQMGGKTGTSSRYSDGWFIGMNKDLVTGVWVGADEPVVRFKNRLGEGAKTALPVFGRYMETVLQMADTIENFPVERGYFPPPSVRITRNYECPTILPPQDTLSIDSLADPLLDVDTAATQQLYVPPVSIDSLR